MKPMPLALFILLCLAVVYCAIATLRWLKFGPGDTAGNLGPLDYPAQYNPPPPND